jgi:HKD family nuclease
MELMNQPFNGQLGNRLIELLDSPDYHTLNIVVAFAKNSGVLRIKGSLDKFRARGGIVNAYVGVDLGVTSYEALTALLLCTNSLNVVHSESSQTFHTKIYHFLGEEKGLIVVGSHNLTCGGLWTNIESSALIPADNSSTNGTAILNAQDDYLSKLTSLKDAFMPIGKQDDIDKLLDNGYISKEVSRLVHLAQAKTQAQKGVRLFGKGAPKGAPPKLPTQTAPASAATQKTKKTAPASAAPAPVPLNDEWQTVWFETRRMTGGSRNILDLSMKSLVERGDPTGTPFDLGDRRFMRGGVQFFDVNPTNTAQDKNITLNFDGVDYVGNTIKFPDGDSANGSWRLQIKGISSSNVKITDAFRTKDKELHLVAKVITFSKVQGDYYFMSVFPESELKNFKAASRILARNGSTKSAKQLGLL